MKCISCHTENKSSSSHCERCGLPLLPGKSSGRFRKSPVFVFMAVLMVCAGVFAYLFQDIIPRASEMMERIFTVDKAEYDKGKHGESGEPAARPGVAKEEQSEVKNGEKEIATETDEAFSEDLISGKEVVAGWVTITDPWGRQVRKFRAGLTGNGWLALPARACLGGNSWNFDRDSGWKAEISGGLWIHGDKVGLWHLAENAGAVEGPELAAWNSREAVSWLSLESASEYHSIKLNPDRAEGFFVSSSLPDYINETGVFIQDGKVVGWSFGRRLAKGYMWPATADTEMEYRTWVRYFYDMTFANGREEKFASALAMRKGNTGLEQLAAFIEGFRVQPKLSLEDTPHYLLPEEIVKHMRGLVTDAVRSGEGSRIADMFSGQVLRSVGSIMLLMDVVPAIADARGYEAAVGEIEDSGRYIVREMGLNVPALYELHVKLYRDWLQSLISSGEVEEGWKTYDSAKAYYPDDAYIHLLGVELALLSGDWEEAERLLSERSYPPDFQDLYDLLTIRITEMKGREGKIVIRFPRGSNNITVTAAVNDTLYQDFLVDTGASTVTIPSSTADALGLEAVRGKRRLWTAGGVVTVSEVVIDAIEINGWVEYDIRAVVLDIPDRPGQGLLGLNYLGRFQMDLKPAEGMLLLTPR